MSTLVIVLGLFIVVLALLVGIRARLGAKFDIKNTDIALALVPIALWLFLSGRVQEFAFGDFRIVAAIRDASQSQVAPQVTKIPFENIQVDAKAGIDMIPRLLQQKSQALGFNLGRGAYYYGPAIVDYFRELTRTPYLRYVVINNSDGSFFGMTDARQLGALITGPGGSQYAEAFAGWLNSPDGERLETLPGFIPARKALNAEDDKQQALRVMDSLDVQALPVVSAGGKFAGVVDRSKLTASILVDIADRLEKGK